MISYWIECLEWLKRCKVISEQPINDAFEFAHMLRDGVILCNLSNSLKPSCINVKDINFKPQLRKIFCIKNIRLFLYTCQTFGIQANDLFDPDMLYDLTDFGKVIKTLYILSKTPQALKFTHPFDCDKESFLNTKHKRESYKNFELIAEQYNYKRQEVFMDENDELYEQLCTLRRTSHQALLPSPKDKWEHCVHELIETENNYIFALKDVVDNFLQPMRSLPNTLTDMIYGKIEILIDIHENFEKRLSEVLTRNVNKVSNYQKDNRLNRAVTNGYESSLLLQNLTKCPDKQNSKPHLDDIFTKFDQSTPDSSRPDYSHSSIAAKLGNDIGECFMEFVDKFLVYGEYCTHLGRSQAYIDKLLEENEAFKALLQECQMNTSQGKFHLRDLIALPLQRILKYHILIKELLKNSPFVNDQNKSLQKALEAMLDLTDYINELKRDTEDMELTNEIQKNISNLYVPDNKELNIYGKLIRDGELKIKSLKDSRLKNRYVFLFDTIIIFCKLTKSDTYNFKVAINVDDCYLNLPQNIPESIKQDFLYSLRESVQFDHNSKETCYPTVHGEGGSSTIFSSNNHPTTTVSSSFVRSRNQNNQPKKLSFDITQTDWWKQKYKKRGEYKWNYTFLLLHKDDIFNVYAKTYDSWIKWLQAFTLAKDNLLPSTLNTVNNHPFQYVTFSKPTRCSFCKKFLKGAIYQGYRCKSRTCGYVSHKQCIQLIQDPCEPNLTTNHYVAPPFVPIRTFEEKPLLSEDNTNINDLNNNNTNLYDFKINYSQSSGNIEANTRDHFTTDEAKFITSSIDSPPKSRGPAVKTYLKKKSTTLSQTLSLFHNNGNQTVTTTTPSATTLNTCHANSLSTSALSPYSRTVHATRSIYDDKNNTNNLPPRNSFRLNNVGTLLPRRESLSKSKFYTSDRHAQSNSTSRNYFNLNLRLNPWYFCEMNRDSAKICLQNKPSGTFLVRESSHHNGNPVITLNYQNEIKHIKILHDEAKGFYISDCKHFPSIVELISHYRDTSLALLFEGINTCLAFPYVVAPELKQSETNFDDLSHVITSCLPPHQEQPSFNVPFKNAAKADDRSRHFPHSRHRLCNSSFFVGDANSNIIAPSNGIGNLLDSLSPSLDRFFFDEGAASSTTSTTTHTNNNPLSLSTSHMLPLLKHDSLKQMSNHSSVTLSMKFFDQQKQQQPSSNILNISQDSNNDPVIQKNGTTPHASSQQLQLQQQQQQKSSSSSCDTTISSSITSSLAADNENFSLEEDDAQSQDTLLTTSKKEINERFGVLNNPDFPKLKNPYTCEALSDNDFFNSLRYMGTQYKLGMLKLPHELQSDPDCIKRPSLLTQCSNGNVVTEIPPPLPFDAISDPNASQSHRGSHKIDPDEPYHCIGIGVAIYSFNACNDSMISFKAGDKIYIVDKVNNHKHWWKGHLPAQDKIGYFPKDYVTQEEQF